jgi:phosphoribosyl 1,2-cyclic phosphate phosphodiesterase
VLFLGTGTSHGVPMIGCDCRVCRSEDSRDKRLRPSIVVELDDALQVLVDTTPDLRTQALAHKLRRVDALLYTHSHADHVFGLDEIRRFNALGRSSMPIFADPPTLADVRRIFSYAFDPDASRGGGVPDLRLWTIGGPFCIGPQEIVPVPIWHGSRLILGYRFGGFAYLTDCSGIPESSIALLEGLDVLVLDALRRREHPTHFNLDQAVAMAQRLRARQTYFTHITHDLGHAETCASLPEGIALAYDGLNIPIAPTCR